MKKVVICLFLLVFTLSTLASQSVTLATGEWPPFAGEKLKAYGLFNDIVAQAFKLEGITATFEFSPWVRCYNETLNATYLGTPGWASTAERKEKFILNDTPIIVDSSILIYNADSSFNWSKPEDLKKYTIASNKADYYVGQLQKLGVKVVEVETYELGLKMLLAKRFDAYVISETVGRELIRVLPQADKNKVKVHTNVYDVTNYYILFSRKFPNVQSYVAKFNSGLEKLKKSGKYDLLIQDFRNGAYN